MSLRLTLVWSVLPLLLAGISAVNQTATPRIPSVEGAIAPTYPFTGRFGKITGSVRLRVQTDGRRSISVLAIGSAPLVLEEAARKEIASWEFVRHEPTTFESVFRYGLTSGSVCNPRENLDIILNLPTAASIAAPTTGYCDPAPLRLRRPSGGSRIAGVVRCACADRRPLANVAVSVRLWDSDAELREERRTRTERGGSFVVDNLPGGTYALELTAAGFMPRLYQVRVAGDTTAPLPLSLEEDPKWVPEPAVVTHSEVPVYPTEARRRGVQGEVHVRIGGNGSQISHVSGDSLLATAALAIVKSWQFKRPPDDAFEVVFEYRLTPGDCSGDDRPTVRLQFPHHVSVTAKRIIPCG